jgi:hypothetical protein
LRAFISHKGECTYVYSNVSPSRAGRLGTAASFAAVPATAAPNDDAKLLELGRELDAALVDWSAQLKAEQLDGAEFEAECFRATGMTYAAATAAAEQFVASGRGHVADAEGKLEAYFKERGTELSRAPAIATQRNQNARLRDRLQTTTASVRLSRPSSKYRQRRLPAWP